MKYSKEYINGLLDKYFEGQTTENEEQTLSEFFANEKDIPTELMPCKEMFQSFKTDVYDFTDEELDAMMAATEKNTNVIRLWSWISSACAAIVCVAIYILHPWDNSAEPAQSSSAYVNLSELANTKDISMAELLETIETLSEVAPDDVTITVSHADEGFVVKTASQDDKSSSFLLKRNPNDSSIELKSQSTNL